MYKNLRLGKGLLVSYGTVTQATSVVILGADDDMKTPHCGKFKNQKVGTANVMLRHN